MLGHRAGAGADSEIIQCIGIATDKVGDRQQMLRWRGKPKLWVGYEGVDDCIHAPTTQQRGQHLAPPRIAIVTMCRFLRMQFHYQLLALV